MPTHYDDTVLMAFADGQLNEPLFGQVADAVEADPELARRLELLVTGKDLARAVYVPLAERPVPPALLRGVKAAIAATERRRAVWPGFALAAAIGVIAAVPLGYFLGRTMVPAHLGVGTPLAGELAGQLAALPSGAELHLADGTLLRPVASFHDGQGTLCREFELDGSTATVAIACRAGTDWRVAFALDAPVADDGYAPAGALEALDAYLGSIGATAPLDPTVETQELSDL